MALNREGTKIASSSTNGAISIWDAEIPPCETDILFSAADNNVKSLSFRPDSSELLVCLDQEVQIWNLEKRLKIGQVPNLGSLNTSFSCDGQFIIVGNTTRTTVWDARAIEMVFDTASETPQQLSFSEAKTAIQTCGPPAHRMWPTSLRASEAGVSSPPCASSVTELTVDNIFSIVTYHIRPEDMLFSGDIFVLNYFGMLEIFKMRK